MPPKAKRAVSHPMPQPPAQAGGNTLEPRYDKSWAVVIGINNYRHVRKLDYAVSDAAGIAELLVGPLGFPRQQVFVVLDRPPKAATGGFDLTSDCADRDTIEKLLETQLPQKMGLNDRLLVFFAGHGERRLLPDGGEIGYLIPADAAPGAWHTYVRTDKFINIADYCSAKHVFFLIDACYSGLALPRDISLPTRYHAGMLTNRARQALTAGTAKEVVTDKGPGGHSLFTWYVLQGLRGEADLNHDQVITATELMLYVRDHVAAKFGSKQTPDFGALQGHESGGDFIFVTPPVNEPAVDLSRWVTIHNVGNQPTCAAWATVTAIETSLARQGHRVSLDATALYDIAKVHDGTGDPASAGTYLTTVVYVAEQFGTRLSDEKRSRGINAKLVAAAATTQSRFFRLNSLDEIPGQLKLGRPVVAGVTIYEKTFETAEAGFPMPAPGEKEFGSHAITIVGHDPKDGTLRFANCFGTSWGKKGFGTMSAQVAQKLLQQDSMWAVEARIELPARPMLRGVPYKPDAGPDQS